MKVAIISDTHFGFGWGTERQDDPFDAVQEALEKSTDADLIILPGDIFDNRNPKQDVLSRAADTFRVAHRATSDAHLLDISDKQFSFSGIPLIAIHGTHDRRAKGFVNPVHLLDKFGVLAHLHCETLVFEKDGEKVAIHGMSGVPEVYAADVLRKWDPQPIEGAYNILMFHQNVKGFVYTEEGQSVITVEDLPEGFDLIVDGHIHWRTLDNKEERKNLIFAGSVITTQMNKTEADTPKGFLTLDTKKDAIEFVRLEHARPLIYEEISVDGKDAGEIRAAVRTTLDEIRATHPERKPLVRIVLTGETDAEISLTDIQNRAGEDMFLNITKRFGSMTSSAIDTFRSQQQNIFDQGMQLLEDRMDLSVVEVSTLFDLLTEGAEQEALALFEDIGITALKDDLTDAAKETDVRSEEQPKEGTLAAFTEETT